MNENIEPNDKSDYFLDKNGNILETKINDVVTTYIPKPKSKAQWYKTSNVHDYITGKSDETIFGRGARSLDRAARDYQYLSEDFSRHQYSPKFMARKYDKFGGIDLDLIELTLKNKEEEYNSARTKFESGEISEREFNRIAERYQRTLNNLNGNYKSLHEVWHGKNDIPLVRTQSSVSSLPFMLGTVGFPFALIAGIEGAIATAPWIGKALANPWVQRGLTGLDVVDTGIQVASGNYLGAAANWIPYDKVLSKFKKLKYVPNNIKERAKNLYNRYTAPRTTIKHTPYKGDQYQLAKFRLVNGGFDKLGIHAEDAMFLPKEHPMVTAGYGYDDAKWANDTPVNARTFLLKSQPVPLREKYNGIAWYDTSDKMYSQPSYGKYSKLDMDTKAITAHEYQHAVDDVRTHKNRNLAGWSESPRVTPPGTDMSKVPWYIQDYFQADGGTELHARLAQLKNWYGITDPNQQITPEMWNYARRHYVPTMKGFDNNMQHLFRVVTDPKKFLDWINPRVASQAGVVGTAGLSLINDENDENSGEKL